MNGNRMNFSGMLHNNLVSGVALGLALLALPGFAQHVTRTLHDRYTPGQTLTVTLTYDPTGLSNPVGYTIIDHLPNDWSTVTPQNLTKDGASVGPPKATAAPGVVQFDYGDDNTTSPVTFTYDILVPGISDTPLTFPDHADAVTLTYKFGATASQEAIGGDSTVNPPLPPVFTNPAPPQGQTAEGVANITNTVIAGQAMQFQVKISASTGQALTGTAFAVGPTVWNNNRWELKDQPETWFTYTPPARDIPSGYVDFSDASGTFSRTVKST